MKRGIFKGALVILLFIFLLNPAIAKTESFATFDINYQLSFYDASVQQIVEETICDMPSFDICKDGKIANYVDESLVEELKEKNKEAAEVVLFTNHIFELVATSSTPAITETLKFNNMGNMNSGILYFACTTTCDISQFFTGEAVVSLLNDIKFKKEEENIILTFKSDSAKIDINGNSFENIRQEKSSRKAFLKISNECKLIEADFTATNKGGEYIIGNDRISVPPDSRLVFKNGKIKLIFSSNTQLKEFPSLLDTDLGGNVIRAEGQNIRLPDGTLLEKGALTFIDSYPYIKKGDYAVIDNFKITADKVALVGLKFEGLEGTTFPNFVSFSEDKAEANGEGFAIQFDPDIFLERKKEDSPVASISLSNAKNRKYFWAGDTGEDVKKVQELVGVEQDGIYGKKTMQAVKIYQGENEITKDGKFGPQSLETALTADKTRMIEIIPDGGVSISKKDDKIDLALSHGSATYNLGSETYTVIE
ncbi:hypothetical protein HZB88_04120, partial [archaeon]|nr:hypothetical protein [archaeon]